MWRRLCLFPTGLSSGMGRKRRGRGDVTSGGTMPRSVGRTAGQGVVDRRREGRYDNLALCGCPTSAASPSECPTSHPAPPCLSPASVAQVLLRLLTLFPDLPHQKSLFSISLTMMTTSNKNHPPTPPHVALPIYPHLTHV